MDSGFCDLADEFAGFLFGAGAAFGSTTSWSSMMSMALLTSGLPW
ncbi:hypothetical protein [Rhodococcus opacus]|nr:hypothetical protein [Rhodococcus opacus]